MAGKDRRLWLVPAALLLAALAWWAWPQPPVVAAARADPPAPAPAALPQRLAAPPTPAPAAPPPAAPTPEDAAREAVAEAMGGYVIRCTVPRVDGRVYALPRNDPMGEVDGDFVTLVVDAPEGRQVLRAMDMSSLTGGPVADAWVEWSGARAGVTNPCRVERGRKYRTRVEVELPADPTVAFLAFPPCGTMGVQGEPPWDVEVLGGWPEPCVFQFVAFLPDGKNVTTEPVAIRAEDLPATLRLELAEPEPPRDGAIPEGIAAYLDAPAEDPDTPLAIALERDDLDPATRAVLEDWRLAEEELLRAQQRALRESFERSPAE